jgi:hypothetical protein
MPEITLGTMRSDVGRAQSIFGALQPVLEQAHALDATTPDQLAAVALALAFVIRRSTLREDPQVAIEAVAGFVREVLATTRPAGPAPPPF